MNTMIIFNKTAPDPEEPNEGSPHARNASSHPDTDSPDTCPRCGASREDLAILASLCCDFKLSELPEATLDLRAQAVACASCRAALRNAILEYLVQAVADDSYEARRMDALMGYAELPNNKEKPRIRA